MELAPLHDLSQTAHAAISAVCPIDGVAIGDPADKSTWRIDFSGEATMEQREAADLALIDFSIPPG